MIVNPTIRTTPISTNAFSKASAASDPSSSFEAQLSSALAESLEKLGVGSGEVNITIRNPTSTTRQIVVTYSVDGAKPNTPTPTTTSGSGATTGTTSGSTSGTTSGSATAPATTPSTTPAKSTTVLPTPQHNPFTLPTVPYQPPVAQPSTDPTPWAPYDGPRDFRDEMPVGSGQTTATGAPLIKDNAKAAGNQYGFTGPAAKNPYFSTPSNPLREGYVLGFDNWFETPMIIGGKNGPQPANRKMYSTEEGAKEALRIIQLFEPQATMVKSVWQSGPFSVDTPMYEIELAGGRRLNAGGVLSAYYTHGYGVTASCDETIRRSIQLA